MGRKISMRHQCNASGRRSAASNHAAMDRRQQIGQYNAAAVQNSDHIRIRREVEGAMADHTQASARTFTFSHRSLPRSTAGNLLMAMVALSLMPGAGDLPASSQRLPPGRGGRGTVEGTGDPFVGAAGSLPNPGTSNIPPPRPTVTPEPSVSRPLTAQAYEQQGARPKHSNGNKRYTQTAAIRKDKPSAESDGSEEIAWQVDHQPPPAHIHGGRPLRGPSDTRHLAYITKGQYSCSGTVIGERHVLTAQHCVVSGEETFEDFANVRDVKVCLPEGNRDNCNSGNTRGVQRIYLANRYYQGGDYQHGAPRTPSLPMHDAAILELDSDIQDYVDHPENYPEVPSSDTYEDITKACSHKSVPAKETTKFYLQGFGRVATGDSQAVAREIEVDCQKAAPVLRFRSKDGGAQQGDSGGTVLVEHEGDRYVIGDITASAGPETAFASSVQRHRRMIKAVVRDEGVNAQVIGCVQAAQKHIGDGHQILTLINTCNQPVEAICLVGEYPDKDIHKHIMEPNSRYFLRVKDGVVRLHGVVKSNNYPTQNSMDAIFREHAARDFDRQYLGQIRKGWSGPVDMTLENLQLAVTNDVPENSESEKIIGRFVALAAPQDGSAFLHSCKDPVLLNRYERLLKVGRAQQP